MLKLMKLKQRNRKRICSLLLSVLLVIPNFLLFPLEAHAATYTDETGVTFTYEEIDDGTAISITYISYPNDAQNGSVDLMIPETIDGKPVTTLNCNLGLSPKYHSVAFNSYIQAVPHHFANGCALLETVTFPENSQCTQIREAAFADTNLSSINFPDGLTLICEKAFQNCALLTEVSFGDHLETIEYYAFGGTGLASLTLPDSVKTVGNYAFGDTYLTSLDLGNGLESIGEAAFCAKDISHMDYTTNTYIYEYSQKFTSVTFPDTLKSIGKNAFRQCTSLSTVVWPENDEFTTIDGFGLCTGLSNQVLSSIPENVTTIAAEAFMNCNFTQIRIPESITSIGNDAFNNNRNAASLIIDGTDATPALTIGAGAFSNCNALAGRTIVLPKRVSSVSESTFFFGTANYLIHNPALELYSDSTYSGKEVNIGNNTMLADPWPTSGCKIYYSPELTEETSPTFHAYVTKVKNHTFQEGLEELNSDISFQISGTVPSGASAQLLVNGKSISLAINNNRFSYSLPAKTAVTVVVCLDGYVDEFFSKTASAFTSDWDIGTLTTDDMTLINNTGFLKIVSLGAGAGNNYVSIFDENGACLETGRAQAGIYVSNKLKAGDYTVLAYADNPYIDSVTALDAFAKLGIPSTCYITAQTTVTPADTVECTLTVPAMNTAQATTVLNESGSLVFLQDSRVTKNLTFFAEVAYRMTDGKNADEIRIVIPDGFDVTSVTSASRSFNVSNVYNSSTHTVTIADLSESERNTGSVYVGLRGNSIGKYSISASILSGGITAPIGSADFALSPLILDIPETSESRTFSVTVFAEPKKSVRIKAADGGWSSVTTNAMGFVTKTITVPFSGQYASYAPVTAEVTDSEGHFTTTHNIYFLGDANSQLKDFYFIHGRRRVDLMNNYQDKSGGYYIYQATGDEANKYWTFGATIESRTPITGEVTVGIYMKDGQTARFETMELLSCTENTSGNYQYTQTYGCTVYIEQVGDHLFDKSLIPVGFDISFPQEPETGGMDFDWIFNDNLTDEEREEERMDLIRSILTTHIDGFPDYTDEDVDALWDTDAMGGTTLWDSVLNGESSIFAVLNTPNWMTDDINDTELWEAFDQIWENDAVNSNEETDPETVQSKFDASITKLQSSVNELFQLMKDLYDHENAMTDYSSGSEYVKNTLIDVSDVPAAEIALLEDQDYTILSTDNSSRLLAVKTETDPAAGENVKVSAVEQIYPADPVYQKIYYDAKGKSESDFNDFLAMQKLGIIQDALEETNLSIKILDTWPENEVTREYTKELSEKLTKRANNAVEVGEKAIGVYKIYKGLKKLYNDSYEWIAMETRIKTLEGEVEKMKMFQNWWSTNGSKDGTCLSVLAQEISAAEKLLSLLKDNLTVSHWDVGVSAAFTGVEMFETAASFGIEGVTPREFSVVGNLNNAYDWGMAATQTKLQMEIAKALEDYHKASSQSTKYCGNRDEELRKARFSKDSILDPSGIVYEAVESNLLSGVTATVYVKESGNTWKLWDADEYDQENPQTTEADGAYAWYVPEGIYKVRFEKTGYEPAEITDLVVPPPRMNLKTGLISTVMPTMESLTVYSDYMEVIFSQYMKTGDESGIVCTVNGNAITNADAFQWQEPEESLSKVLHIVAPEYTTSGNALNITISGAKNYAGNAMSAPKAESAVSQGAAPGKLLLNYDSIITVPVGETKNLTVRVRDTAGNPMSGVTVTASVDNTYLSEAAAEAVTDEDGKAQIAVNPLLPGMTGITFTVKDSSLTCTRNLLIYTGSNQTARPTATIGDCSVTAGSPKENYATVESGALLTIQCATEGATIYYTTDDTCPCQNSENRQVYTAPIPVTQDTRFRIAALKDGMDYSERININVTIAQPAEPQEPEPSSESSSTPEPEPSSESSSTPEPEPSSEQSSSPEPDPSSESSSTPESEPSSESSSSPEPEPSSEQSSASIAQPSSQARPGNETQPSKEPEKDIASSGSGTESSQIVADNPPPESSNVSDIPTQSLEPEPQVVISKQTSNGIASWKVAVAIGATVVCAAGIGVLVIVLRNRKSGKN